MRNDVLLRVISHLAILTSKPADIIKDKENLCSKVQRVKKLEILSTIRS